MEAEYIKAQPPHREHNCATNVVHDLKWWQPLGTQVLLWNSGCSLNADNVVISQMSMDGCTLYGPREGNTEHTAIGKMA